MSDPSIESLQAKVLKLLHQFHSDPPSVDVPGTESSPVDELRAAVVEYTRRTSVPEGRALLKLGGGWPASLGALPDLTESLRTGAAHQVIYAEHQRLAEAIRKRYGAAVPGSAAEEAGARLVWKEIVGLLERGQL